MLIRSSQMLIDLRPYVKQKVQVSKQEWIDRPKKEWPQPKGTAIMAYCWETERLFKSVHDDILFLISRNSFQER